MWCAAAARDLSAKRDHRHDKLMSVELLMQNVGIKKYAVKGTTDTLCVCVCVYTNMTLDHHVEVIMN